MGKAIVKRMIREELGKNTPEDLLVALVPFMTATHLLLDSLLHLPPDSETA